MRHWALGLSLILSLGCPGGSDQSSAGGEIAADAGVETPPRLVVLISLDTLRPDRLGAYGHDQFTSPNLDMLAAEGVVFEDANSPAPWTLPAHASMLTGRTPAGHGVMRSATTLPKDVPTLASSLIAAGYETAAVVSVDWLRQDPYALTRDFEKFHYQEIPLGRQSINSLVTDKATEWIAAIDQRPLFLFVHYFDLHTDYASEPGYEALFVTPYDGIADGTGLQLQKANLPSRYVDFCHANPGIPSCAIGYLQVDGSVDRIEFDAADVLHLEQLYDAGIRQLDTELLRLFAAIRAAGLYDDTLFIVTSDHGEAFGEHGQYEHYLGLNQEVLRVPLIVRGPTVPRGKRIETPVSTVDIVPTILALTGALRIPGVEGLDLTPLWRVGEHDTITKPYLERSLPGEASGALQFDAVARPFLPFHRSLRRGRFKLICDENAKTAQLYDLIDDPGERIDISAREPLIAAQLLEELEARELGLNRPPGPTIELDPEEERRLRALGYVP